MSLIGKFFTTLQPAVVIARTLSLWFDRLTTLSRVEGPKGTRQSQLTESRLCDLEPLRLSDLLRMVAWSPLRYPVTSTPRYSYPGSLRQPCNSRWQPLATITSIQQPGIASSRWSSQWLHQYYNHREFTWKRRSEKRQAKPDFERTGWARLLLRTALLFKLQFDKLIIKCLG